MNIVVLSVYPFPNGFAATNRIISYSKGLIYIGNKVTNIIVRPTEKEQVANHLSFGSYEGIDFIYSNAYTKWHNNIIIKVVQAICGLFLSLKILLQKKKENKLDIIIVSIDNFIYDIIYILFARYKLKTKIVFISDEYPFVLRKNKGLYKILPFLIRFEEKYCYKFFDGIIVMTKALEKYFIRITKNKIPIQIVLMTVELERFNLLKSKNSNIKYLAYIGDLTSEKDGVDILLKSFSAITEEFPDYVLIIAGSTKNKKDVEKLYQLVDELKLEDKVKFLGKLKREDVPQFLINAELLLLSRPKTQRAEGGFPTKLGEYLATGNPVIVTKVGEIPEYLEDGKSAFLAEPDSESSLTNKIREALANYEKAKIIGANGKKVAVEVFNYKVQAKVMSDFLEKIVYKNI